MKILEKLQKEDLSDDMRILAEHIGLENVKKIIAIYGGWRIYIPSVYSHKRLLKRVLNELRGKSDLEIALITGLSEKKLQSLKKELQWSKNTKR